MFQAGNTRYGTGMEQITPPDNLQMQEEEQMNLILKITS